MGGSDRRDRYVRQHVCRTPITLGHEADRAVGDVHGKHDPLTWRSGVRREEVEGRPGGFVQCGVLQSLGVVVDVPLAQLRCHAKGLDRRRHHTISHQTRDDAQGCRDVEPHTVSSSSDKASSTH